MTFRPTRQPAQRIYDALLDEASKRQGLPPDEWQQNELERVWREARDWAQQHGLPVPTIDQVEDCELLAIGHVDYAAKWAYAVADLLRKKPQ